MSTRERSVDAGSRRAQFILADLGNELRIARLDHGLSQSGVGRTVGISGSQVSRIERGVAPSASIRQLARLLSVVGLHLAARAYPNGTAIRDAGHRALLDRLRKRLPTMVDKWRFEVALPASGELRAWDAVIDVGGRWVAIEAETRPRDVQSLQRRLAAKRRDDPRVSAVVLLLSDTRHNRSLMRDHGDALRSNFPDAHVLVTLASSGIPDRGGVALV
jgi:transcriptional regulator with XRE-family HTH domain